jgi:hypothetical protein
MVKFPGELGVPLAKMSIDGRADARGRPGALGEAVGAGSCFGAAGSGLGLPTTTGMASSGDTATGAAVGCPAEPGDGVGSFGRGVGREVTRRAPFFFGGTVGGIVGDFPARGTGVGACA